MSESWVKHEVEVYDIDGVPVDGGDDSFDISRVAIRVPGYVYPVDVGSWCYTERRRLGQNKFSGSIALKEVVKSSYRKQRGAAVTGFVDFIRYHLSIGKSKNSIKGFLSQFQIFISWCDDCRPEGLDGPSEFIEAVSGYTENLIQRVRWNRLNRNTAATFQQVVMLVGRFLYEDPYMDLFRSVRRIRRSLGAVVKTEVPGDDVAGTAFKAYQEIFAQLSGFVLNHEPFPKKIVIGKDYFWFFPTALPIAGPATVGGKKALGKRYICYDYIKGEIRSLKDVARLSESRFPGSIAQSVRRARANIDKANEDYFHERRIFAATFAVQSFLMIFSASTGMNLGQMLSIPWEEEYDFSRERLGFRGLKSRAGNKEVTFYLSSGIFPAFNLFLRLRAYLSDYLGSKGASPFLFFNVVRGEARAFGSNFSNHFHSRIRSSFGLDMEVSTRMWRAFKADWLLANVPFKTSVLLMQNSPATMLRHYADGSEQKSDKELGKFLSSYKAEIVISDSKKDAPLSVGHCHSMNPSPLFNASINPDCRKEEGCLFCDKYRVHLDEKDYRKLVSFRYVLEISRPLAKSDDHFAGSVSAVLKRIDELLGLMASSSDDLKAAAGSIYRDVYECENLSGFWAAKLRLLDDLGVGM